MLEGNSWFARKVRKIQNSKLYRLQKRFLARRGYKTKIEICFSLVLNFDVISANKEYKQLETTLY